MKKVLGFIISLIMIFSAVGCMDNNTNPFPINPDSSNSATDTDGGSKGDSSDGSKETEDDISSENGDDSSSNENENKPSNEIDGWTGFY